MRPVLFEILGFPVQSYGVSKVLAALVAGVLLSRAFRQAGWDPEKAWNMVVYGTVVGFIGAKVYYVAEHASTLSWHHLGGSGFTWYGGMLAGLATVMALARVYRLPWGRLAGMSAVPLSLAYGIGRLGCFLAGDGTYGRPTDLPWGMSFPHGVVPTVEPVHPTALYEAAMAFALAAVLWSLRRRTAPLTLFGIYAFLSGLARFWVETLRINEPVVAGLTQPQLWSTALMVTGLTLLLRSRRDTDGAAGGGPGGPRPSTREQQPVLAPTRTVQVGSPGEASGHGVSGPARAATRLRRMSQR
jgi:phosphatidylglycerol:prolipoprotein diacylglycerol transferase